MYKNLTDGHWISNEIEEGEVFPVGGSFPRALDLYMTVDFNSFHHFFEKVSRNAENLKKHQPLKEWYEKTKQDLDYNLFCHMYAFNLVMKSDFPEATKNADKRVELYEKTGKQKLSESVAGGFCACVEFSVLAKGYFQSQGIPARYVGGELISNEQDFDDFEAHSFIVFQDNEKDYVYDPVNPLPNKLPRIAEFVVGKKEMFYVETKKYI